MIKEIKKFLFNWKNALFFRHKQHFI